MKNLFLFCILLSGTKIFAQDTINVSTYKYDPDISFSRIILTTPDSGIYKFIEKYDSGNLKSEGFLSSRKYFIKTGKEILYHKNGAPSVIQNYKEGKLLGEYRSFYPNGKPWLTGEFLIRSTSSQMDYPNFIARQLSDSLGRPFLDGQGNGILSMIKDGSKTEGKYINGKKQGEWKEVNLKNKESYLEQYENGAFLKGVFTDISGQKYYYIVKHVEPTYKGGMQEFYRFLFNNLVYPRKMQELNIEGQVILSFIIETDGSLNDIRVIQGVQNGDALAQEAIRVLKLSKGWVSSTYKGKQIRASFTLPINFSLN